MTYPTLVSEYRGDTLENVHTGVVCGINEHREVIFQQGDIQHPTYYRSAMKPFQAVPVFYSGVIDKYNLTSDEAALFAASHRGEAYHAKSLQAIMDKCGLSESSLICHASYPLNEEPKLQYVWEHGEKRRIFHNCAGKHLGFLACCQANGWPLEGYEQPDHPLQQQILDIVSHMTEIDKKDIHKATDGCGTPVYAVPLYNMALSYLKLAQPELITDRQTREAVTDIGQAMNSSPDMVASHQFVCSELLRDPNIIAKGGAQGAYCFALRKEKLSLR